MPVLASVAGRVIHDSRGQSTVEVTLTDTEGTIATASVPAGTSVGKYEAKPTDPEQAVSVINTTYAPALLRYSLDTQAAFDTYLLSLVQSNATQFSGSSILGISLAGARLVAQVQKKPLYAYLAELAGGATVPPVLPSPVFNIINGGKHAENNLDFQEYLIIPVSMKSFHEKLQVGKKIFATLGDLLRQAGHEAKIGSEGGYAPNLSTNEEGMGFLVQAITAAGYVPGSDVLLGLDVAASALPPTFQSLVSTYMSLAKNFPLFWIEDPFVEDDWNNWSELKLQLDTLSESTYTRLLVGDDLFVGNKQRLEEGIKKYAANAILIKVNQSPTLTETLSAIQFARQHSYLHLLSHRSGETLDSFVSDLAVGTGSAFIKAGSPSDQAPERIIKYDRLAEIEEELGLKESSDA